MKFTHVSMVARSTDKLADFYKTVFGCEDRKDRWQMSGELVSRGNGVPGAEIYCAHLTLPGVDGPFLEIFEYKDVLDRGMPPVNQPGYSHISFKVDDIQYAFDSVLAAGGTALGEITDFGTPESPFVYTYVRDPEGNVIELEQR